MRRHLIVQVNSKLRITSDAHSFRLEKPAHTDKGTGEVLKWKPFAYLMTIAECLRRARDEIVRKGGQTTLNGLRDLIIAQNARIEEIGDQCVDCWGKDEEE